jgi:hypothetical protein
MISSSDSAIRDVRSGLPNPSGERLGFTAISDGLEWVSFETKLAGLPLTRIRAWVVVGWVAYRQITLRNRARVIEQSWRD